MASAEAQARYNASPKGKARKARYEATASARSLARAAERRRYARRAESNGRPSAVTAAALAPARPVA